MPSSKVVRLKPDVVLLDIVECADGGNLEPAGADVTAA
jgi:hypothetical protein